MKHADKVLLRAELVRRGRTWPRAVRRYLWIRPRHRPAPQTELAIRELANGVTTRFAGGPGRGPAWNRFRQASRRRRRSDVSARSSAIRKHRLPNWKMPPHRHRHPSAKHPRNRRRRPAKRHRAVTAPEAGMPDVPLPDDEDNATDLFGPTTDHDPPPALPRSFTSHGRAVRSSQAATLPGVRLGTPRVSTNDPPPAPPWGQSAAL